MNQTRHNSHLKATNFKMPMILESNFDICFVRCFDKMWIFECYIINRSVRAVKFTHTTLSHMLLDRFIEDMEGEDKVVCYQMEEEICEFSKDFADTDFADVETYQNIGSHLLK